MTKQLLIQMSGCPGAGKSTLAQALGRETGAVVLDHDVIKSTVMRSGVPFDLAGKAAYDAEHALARSFLAQGLSVIFDSPCHYQELLDKGMALATEFNATYRYIECVTNDLEEIRHRLATRVALPSQCITLDPAPGDSTRRARGESGETMFRQWVANMKRPPHSYLKVDTTQPLPECLSRARTFLDV